MVERAWVHHSGSLFRYASPVDVLSRGPVRARVRLLHALRWNRKDFPAGSTRYVPSHCLGEKPWRHYLVSVGHNCYVPQTSKEGRKAVRRG